MVLVFIKIVVSILVVIGIVFISERNPKIGGLFAGLPLGAGILMFFYALEQGVQFATAGIPYAIAGLTSSLAFAVGFYLGGRLFLKNNILQTASSTFFGVSTFLISAVLISLMNINVAKGIGLFVIAMTLSLLFFSAVSVNKKTIIQRYTLSTITFRAIFVTAIVVALTGFANVVGAKWAGIMASFPTMLFPVLVILSIQYSSNLYPVVLKHFSYSISTLVVYYLLIALLYPKLGIYSGTLLSYLICFMYVLNLNIISNLGLIRKKRSQQRAPDGLHRR